MWWYSFALPSFFNNRFQQKQTCRNTNHGGNQKLVGTEDKFSFQTELSHHRKKKETSWRRKSKRNSLCIFVFTIKKKLRTLTLYQMVKLLKRVV